MTYLTLDQGKLLDRLEAFKDELSEVELVRKDCPLLESKLQTIVVLTTFIHRNAIALENSLRYEK